MADFQKFLSSFDSSNLKGKQFEKFCKWFLENDTYWKSKFTKVYLWDDYPKRWGADLGIDLIAEADDGSLCAIQAKCYSPEYPVTKKDMDSFLSESNRKEISTRLLLASTDIIGGNARKVCQSQEKPVTFFLYSDFLNSTIEFPEDINKLTKPKSKSKPKPRPHQADAIKNVLKGFKKHDRGQLIMACGTGKTFTTLWIKEKLNAETTLILLPSLNLLSQTLKEWYFGTSKPFKSFAVCSDESVTKSTEEDAVKESTQDLSFPVSADPKQIQNFLKQKGTKVLFSTYQSSPMIAEALKSKTVPPFDLVICDEAHRCTGKVGSTFTTVLDDKKIRTKQKLFTTATPRTYSQSVKTTAKIKEIEITGMDDEKVFGPVFHNLSFGQAIANDPPLLTDYQVVVVGIDSPMIKEFIDERRLLEINPDDNIDAESLAAQIGVLKSVKDYGLKRVISFHGRVNRAKNFSKDLIDVQHLVSKKHLPKGILKTDYVSGQMPTNKRYQYLQQLKELDGCDYYILSNARCLSEGVDVPSIDGIAIIDPKKSKTDIVQTIGRAIRLSENKIKGTIVIPVFIEDGDDAEARINKSNFKPVYDVLNALRAHDEALGFELDEMRTELGKKRVSTGPSRRLPKIHIDIPTRINYEFSDAIKTVLVANSTQSWFYWYGLIEKYLEETNTTTLDIEVKTYDVNGNKIGQWINSQRSKKLNLLPKQISMLESLPKWTWNKNDYLWEELKSELFLFIEEFGHPRVKIDYISPTGYELGKKVARFRGSIDTADEKIKFFNNLEGWVSDLKEFYWNENYKFVLNFAKENGHFKVPRNVTILPEKVSPSGWIESVRKYYRDKEPFLTKKRIKLCEKIPNWFWETSINKLHTDGFNALLIYIKQNGHPFAKKDYVNENGVELGKYLINLRDRKRDGNINQEEMTKFENLPNWSWNAKEGGWFLKLSVLKRFINKHKRLPKIVEKFEDEPIGGWVKSQIDRREELTPNKIKALEDLPGWAWKKKHEILWMKSYEKVLANKKSDKEFTRQWIRRQKEKYNSKELSPEQIQFCEKLPQW